MPTFTTNYNFNKPLVNNATDADLWGGQLNSNWDDVDGILFAGLPNLTTEGTIASATTTNLGSVTTTNIISVTGTTTITSFGSSASTAKPLYFIRFTGALTLTNNGTSLILPSGANITTAAGDAAIMKYEGSGNWRCINYTRASGTPIALTDFVSGVIETPDEGDYRLLVNVPYGFTIASTTTRSASGTCTATFKINTTALGGTANSVSTTEQTQAHVSSNALVTGDDLVLTISSNSSCEKLSFTVKFTRAF